jgi:hypothetical protein
LKKLILIRHAESENNVDKREAKVAFNNIKTAQSFPTWNQVGCVCVCVCTYNSCCFI